MNFWDDLHEEIEAMELHDCLRWRIPNSIDRVEINSQLRHINRRRRGMKLKTVFWGVTRIIYIIRME